METTITKPALVPAEGRKTIRVLGLAVDLLLSAEQTGGAFSTYRVTFEPGDSIPAHTHSHDDETFHVLDGEFEIRCGDTVSIVTAGGTAFLPRGLAHGVRNCGAGRGRLLGTCTPGGHEVFLEDASLIGQDGPPAPEAVMAVCLRHGIQLVECGARGR